MQTININVQLTDEQAMALAQFVKRLSWSEIRINAVSDDDAYTMRTSISILRNALADAGYAPQ